MKYKPNPQVRIAERRRAWLERAARNVIAAPGDVQRIYIIRANRGYQPDLQIAQTVDRLCAEGVL